MATKTDFRVTKGLQDALKKNPLIENVYFNEEGEHYFMKHKIKLHKTNSLNQVVSIDEVECLPGAKMEIVMLKQIVNGGVQWKPARRNTSCVFVAAEFSREDILNATPVSDIKTEKEKLEILQAAAEIAKNDDIEGLLKKLKGK